MAKLSKLSDRDEASLTKTGRRERVKAISGTPDEEDIRNLSILFNTYNQVTGGLLRRMADSVKMERALNSKAIEEKSVDDSENLVMWMPKDLQEEVEKYWPSLWTNPKHLRWFLKHFPVFRR
jgi:hypothetical protein